MKYLQNLKNIPEKLRTGGRKWTSLRRGRAAGALALLLAAVFVLSQFMTAYAEEEQHIRVSDGSTMSSWVEEMSAYNTSQVGRIWTDKSVFTKNYSFEGATDSAGVSPDLVGSTVEIDDSDFLVALSALSSQSNVATLEYDAGATPLDVVLVLDISSSMDDDVTTISYTYTEAYNVSENTTYYVSVNGTYYA